ncbi:hypothetical protein BH11BAC2_BH11BAC2_08220 [soil metagenome]
MKKTACYYVLPLLLMVFVSISQTACNKGKKDNSADTPACAKPLNPNGDSELAILMRVMVKATEANTVQLKNNVGIVPYPESFHDILTATPSDSTLDKKMFDGYAKGYIQAITEFNKADLTMQVASHNNVVQSCKSCHEQFCRGPIKRIEKMFIE